MVEQISSLKTGVKYKNTPAGIIPIDWEAGTLSNISEINPKRNLIKDEVYPFVEMAAIDPGSHRVKYIQSRIYKGSGTRFQNGDTLFARITPCTENGKIAFIDMFGEEGFGHGSTEFIVLGPKKNAYQKYIYYCTKWDKVRNLAISKMEGTSGRQRVPNRVFKEDIFIPLPPFSEQKKITEILTSVDDAIEKTAKIIQKAKDLTKGLMQKLFTEGVGHKKFKKTILGKIPVEWKVKKLGQVSELKNGINFRKEQKGQQGILTIDVLNMYSSSIFIEPTSLYRVKLNLMNKKDYILKEGDILFVRSSVKKEGVGWACLFKPFNEQATFCGFLIRARLLKTNISPEFLTYFLRSDRVRGRLISGAGHAAITNINQTTLQDLDIVIPSFGEQKEIVKVLSLIDDQIEKESSHLEQLKLLEKGLMQVLLTGKLRVTV